MTLFRATPSKVTHVIRLLRSHPSTCHMNQHYTPLQRAQLRLQINGPTMILLRLHKSTKTTLYGLSPLWNISRARQGGTLGMKRLKFRWQLSTVEGSVPLAPFNR